MNQARSLSEVNRIELDQRIKSLAKQERELLSEILSTIKEIDRLKMYLEMGYPSLFAYLVEGVGYSEGSAQRRIDGARLLAEAPEIAEKIQSGEIKLSQISMVQKTSREIFRQTASRVTIAEKIEVLNMVERKCHSETQSAIAAFFQVKPKCESGIKIQSDGSVRLELTISKEVHENLKQAQALISHAVPSGDFGEFLDYVANRIIKQKTSPGTSGDTGGTRAQLEGRAQLEAKARAQFNSSVKRTTLADQKCCQYIDPNTGKRCSSNWFLQVDHRHPRWAGGIGAPENAQILCGMHNRLKYRRESGISLAR